MLNGGCCSLLSLLYLVLPVIHTTASLNENFIGHENAATPVTSSTCSIDHLVKWLNLEDLANLISRWAEKENAEPMTVLDRLQNRVSAPDQVHRVLNKNAERKPVQQEFHPRLHSNSHPLRWPPHADAPSFPVGINTGNVVFEPQSRTPIDVFPPTPHLMPPPPFAIRPPATVALRRHEILNDQPRYIPILPRGGFLPPPDANVRIAADGAFSLSPVPVTVTPRMSVVEALQHASPRLRDGEDAVDYEISWSKDNHRKCLAVRSVGSLEASAQFIWEIRVIDSFNQEIWRAMCLPQLNEVQVTPGMIINLNYVSNDEVSGD